MSKIHLYFGQPLFEKGLISNEQWAFNQEVSIETANVESFKAILSVLVQKNRDGDTYFDLCFICMLDEKVFVPRITYEYYVHKRTRYPKITIHGDHLRGLETKKDYFITDELVNQLGRYIEDDFDYEFIESKRVGKTTPKKMR
jgi:hypothetical protein